MNKIVIIAIITTLAATMFSCKSKNKPEAEPFSTPDTMNAATPDSTIYGIAAESGMSTLYLILAGGDTLIMERTASNGTYGEIYGYVTEGDSFAVTKSGSAENGYSVRKAYNLSLLKRFGADFTIRNGLFVLESKDTVSIKSVNDDSLVVVYPSGKEKTFAAKR